MLFCCNYLTTLLFFCRKAPVQHDFLPVLHRICTGFVPDFHRFCTGFAPVLHRFLSKIEKNMAIFCNFFSLCIN